MKVNDNSPNVTAPPSFNRARLSHAYIVAGGLTESIAMAAVCSGQAETSPCMICTHCSKASRHTHPDITIVDKPPDKREILVDQIRELKKDVIVVPNESEKKAYIINNADSMNKNAQNAFLQILEEPPKHAVFILRTNNPAALLPTVRSRCVELKAQPVADNASEAGTNLPSATGEEMANKFFDALEQGNAQLTALIFQLEKLEKTVFSAFLAIARGKAALKLRDSPPGGAGMLIETLARAERILAKAEEMLDLNVSTGHISGMICASLLTINN